MNNTKGGLYMALLMEGTGTEKADRLVTKVYAAPKDAIRRPERANTKLLQIVQRPNAHSLAFIARAMASFTGQEWSQARVMGRLRRLARQGRLAVVVVGRYVYGNAW